MTWNPWSSGPHAACLLHFLSHRRAMKRNVRLRCPFRKGTCEITRKTRRQCQACRLRKCLESGMKKESERRAARGGLPRPCTLREGVTRGPVGSLQKRRGCLEHLSKQHP